MNYELKTLVLALGVLLGTSCSTTQPFAFERLVPADVSFPETVRRVAVVNNVPDIAPASVPGNLTSWMEGEGSAATESLAEHIASTNYFESVMVADTALNTRGATSLDETLLTPEQVNLCTESLQADLLFSLDRVILHARPKVILDEELPVPIDGVEVLITPVVRVYLPGRHTPMFTIAKSDSISWYVADHPTDSLVRHEASVYSGEIPLHPLLPHWEEVNRYYYDGGLVDMRDAGVYVRENRWEEAAALWQRIYDAKKGKTRRLAAFNLALYHEMKDELPQAQEWIARALTDAKSNTIECQQAEHYQMLLAERAKNLGKLNAQMERFGEAD